MSEQWVQHVSGMGKKYQLNPNENAFALTSGLYRVLPNNGYVCALPADEYVPCAPPEVWKEVTNACDTSGNKIIHGDRMIHGDKDYRIRKVQMWRDRDGDTFEAFIVEQRQ